MPPRIPLSGAAAQCCRAAAAVASSSSTLPTTHLHPASLAGLLGRLALASPPTTQTPTTHQQVRHASIVGQLRNNAGSVKRRTRVGRGPSSGHGKTSGRGHKGTGQRTGVNPWFQGGQTPLVVSQGQKGEESIRVPKMAEVNLDSIQAWIDQGRLDPNRQITPKELIECRLARLKDGVKILGRNAAALRQPINVMVSRASASAIAAIEAAGGRIVTRYYTKDSIRRLLAGESVNTEEPLPVGDEHIEGVLRELHGPEGRRLYRMPDPTGRWDIEYYRDPKHRGYLSDQIQPGQSPSLFHRVPKPIDDEELQRVMKIRQQKINAKGQARKHESKLF